MAAAAAAPEAQAGCADPGAAPGSLAAGARSSEPIRCDAGGSRARGGRFHWLKYGFALLFFWVGD